MALTDSGHAALRPPFLLLAVITRAPGSHVADAVERLTSALDVATSASLAGGGDHSLVLASCVADHANEVHDIAERVAADFDVIVLRQWAPTLRQARRTYDAIEGSLTSIRASHDGRNRRCITFSEAILDQWLAGLPPTDRLALVQRLLGGVLTLSPTSSDQLLETVQVLIEENGHQPRAAERLGRHKRSISHRKQRFAEITGLDTNDIQHRLLILVGLRLLRLSGATLPPLGDPRWSKSEPMGTDLSGEAGRRRARPGVGPERRL